jgi:CHAT domain-containing protein
MTRAYDEFRVVVTPSVVPGPVQWTVRVEECSVPNFVGKTAVGQPSMTRAHLSALRRGDVWTDLQKLKEIGSAVWSSTIAPVAPWLDASRVLAQQAGRGMRVVMVRQGEEAAAGQDVFVAVAELPIEALCDPAGEFLALDVLTPVSRGLQIRPDRSPELIRPPLRLLLVVARPGDKPGAQEQQESDAIKNALQGMGPDVKIIECPTGTYEEFRDLVDAHDPHVIHFCGHGGYAAVGDDPTPRPHLCFVRADNQNTREVDAETLAVKLKNRSVRLVVLTACASAAPGPAQGPYWPGALEGIAQRLVLGASGVNAAVAMQFDLEADAAVAFGRAFYAKLLEDGCGLDEAVTCARLEISQVKQVGHRAWVNPAVFWRCKDGKVFSLARTVDPQSVPELVTCQVHLDANLSFLNAPDLTAVQAQFVLNKIAEIEDKRSQLYGQCLRLSAETAAPDTPLRFRVLLRTSTPGVVDQVRFRLTWPMNVGALQSEGVAGIPAPALAQDGNAHRVIVDQASGGAAWPAGERDIGVLRLMVPPGQPAGLLRPDLTDAAITKGVAPSALQTLAPVFFIHQP